MDQIRTLLMTYQGWHSYVFLYFLLASCGAGFPINSDSVIVTSAILATIGFFDIRIVFVIAFFALLTGDTFTFFLGRTATEKLHNKKWFKKILPPHRLQTARKFLDEKGSGMLFFVRFIPLIRPALFFTAGTLQVRPRTFYAMDAAGTLVYLPIVLGISYFMAENIDAVVQRMKDFQFAFFGLALVLVAFILFRRHKKSKRAHSTRSRH